MCIYCKAWKTHAGCRPLCGALPRCGASTCVSMPTTSVLIWDSRGAHALYCTNDYQYCHATRRKENWNSKLRIIRSVKFHACGPNPRAWANPHDIKTPLWCVSTLGIACLDNYLKKWRMFSWLIVRWIKKLDITFLIFKQSIWLIYLFFIF
jgi:hypothetical protein